MTLDGDSIEFVAAEHPALNQARRRKFIGIIKILGWVGALSAKAQALIFKKKYFSWS